MNIRNPLCLGCSGGGGHNTAILAIIQELLKEGVKLTSYPSVLYDDKDKTGSATLAKIEMGLSLMDPAILRKPLERGLSFTPFPLLPTKSEVNKEIGDLSNSQKDQGTRYYIDMLLDVFPSGYQNAAIWNTLQRKDKIEALKKLVNMQASSDAENYEVVKKYFLKMLENANPPYTEIISTQAMALPALCDAVAEYNKNHPSPSPVKIKQYLTDIAGKGAVHFFNALKTLSAEQRSQMELYGVGLTAELMEEMQLMDPSFVKFKNISPQNNPMVRAAFKQQYDLNPDKLIVKTESGEDAIKIKATDKIAAIMLGSQGGEDAITYVEELLKNNSCDKIFVFNGMKEPVKSSVKKFIASKEEYKNKVVLLGNQSDAQIAPIMHRSNIIVTRSGGLSVMEQMAIHTNLPEELAKEKIVLLHHKETGGELSSGISWEDENADALIKYLKERNIRAEKTTTERIISHLSGLDYIFKDCSNRLVEYLQKRMKKITESSLSNYISNNNDLHAAKKLSKKIDEALINKKFEPIKLEPPEFSAAEVNALNNSTLGDITRYFVSMNILTPPTNALENSSAPNITNDIIKLEMKLSAELLKCNPQLHQEIFGNKQPALIWNAETKTFETQQIDLSGSLLVSITERTVAPNSTAGRQAKQLQEVIDKNKDFASTLKLLREKLALIQQITRGATLKEKTEEDGLLNKIEFIQGLSELDKRKFLNNPLRHEEEINRLFKLQQEKSKSITKLKKIVNMRIERLFDFAHELIIPSKTNKKTNNTSRFKLFNRSNRESDIAQQHYLTFQNLKQSVDEKIKEQINKLDNAESQNEILKNILNDLILTIKGNIVTVKLLGSKFEPNSYLFHLINYLNELQSDFNKFVKSGNEDDLNVTEVLPDDIQSQDIKEQYIKIEENVTTAIQNKKTVIQKM